MKNFYYTLATAFLIFGCEQAEPVPELEHEQSSTRHTKEMTMLKYEENEPIDIGVMPMDRELYEYSVEATGERIKEVEESFAWYEKEYGEEYPEKMQVPFLFDADYTFFRWPPPIPCICPPDLIPQEFTGSVKIDGIFFKVFAFDPSLISVHLTNENGEVLYASPEKVKGESNSSIYLKLKQVSEIKGKEFFITVNTNYLIKDKVVKKVLTYTFSEKML